MLCSLKDHLGTRMCDLDHPILAGAENIDKLSLSLHFIYLIAYLYVFTHSWLVKNPIISILVTNPVFLRWECHSLAWYSSNLCRSAMFSG
jgi:hypothetical protein